MSDEIKNENEEETVTPEEQAKVEEKIEDLKNQVEEVKKNPPKKKKRTSLFRKKKEEENKIDIEIEVYSNPDDGEIMTVFTKNLLNFDNMKEYLGYASLNFSFARPDYADITRYRQLSSVTNNSGGITINKYKMREYFIIFHLKEWDLVDYDDDDNEIPIEMKFDNNKALSDETLDVFMSLHPSVIDILMESFEKKVLLE